MRRAAEPQGRKGSEDEVEAPSMNRKGTRGEEIRDGGEHHGHAPLEPNWRIEI